LFKYFAGDAATVAAFKVIPPLQLETMLLVVAVQMEEALKLLLLLDC
jgi:hypothetical protein